MLGRQVRKSVSSSRSDPLFHLLPDRSRMMRTKTDHLGLTGRKSLVTFLSSFSETVEMKALLE